MPITQGDLDHWFKHHPPSGPDDVARYVHIRDAGKAFAEVILRAVPYGADQSAAIRKVREAVMTANAAIACGGE